MDALAYLGFAYYNMGDTQNANEAFNEIINYHPNSSWASQVQAYINGDTGTDTSADATQGEASVQSGQDTGDYSQDTGDYSQDITVLGNGGDTYGYYDPADVAWTDPYTGLNYDMYGNPLGY